MTFDYQSFFTSHGIPHVTSGKNVKFGFVNIRCPLCGTEDPSEHLGCNPENGWWGCWRDRSHRGSTPAYLVMVLLGVDRARAEAIVRDAGYAPPPADELERLVNGSPAAPGRQAPVLMPSHYLEIEPDGATRHFYSHLRDRRGFKNPRRMAAYYGVRADLSERRLILPLLVPGRGRGPTLVGWQARSIGTAALRYVTHPDGDVAKRVLFNHGPAQRGGEVLVVTEGPFDAYKCDWYGQRAAVGAVATLGTSYTDAQVGHLYGLARRYDRVVTLFDPGAEHVALELASALAGCGRPVLVGQVPPSVEDAGALPASLVLPTIRACLAGL